MHLGVSVHSGHYVAFVKKDGKWVQFNDRKVSESKIPPTGYLFILCSNILLIVDLEKHTCTSSVELSEQLSLVAFFFW